MFRRLKALAARGWSTFAPKSLTNRVFALYGVTLFVFFAAGLTLFLTRQFDEQVVERQQSSVMLIEVAAQAIQDSAVIGDYDTVQKTLEKAVQGSFFGSGAFIDLTGAKLEARGSAVPNAIAPAWFERWVASQFYEINRAISVGGKDYGVLRLGFDTRYVAGDMWGMAEVALLAVIVSFVLGLVPIHILLKRWLGNLDRLKMYEEAMATGTLDVSRVQTRGAPEEIQRVVDMFKRTAELVREREVSRRALDNQKFALDQHAIVSITDLAGCITYANDRFCDISGYRREELLGQNHRLVKSGMHSAAFYAELWQTITQGRVWRGEICNRSRRGELYWLSATIVPLLGSDGLPEQYIAIRTDITDRKGIESRLESAKEAAVQASVAKTQFLANVSHEIRTPLNAVLGMLKLLQGTALNARQSDYVAKSESAARSLLLLLNDVLDFSKAEANRIELDPRAFQMDALMGDLAVVLGANLGAKSVELVFDIDGSVPNELVGDDLRLQQVLINLGGNAVKFTEQGEVVVAVRALEQDDDQVLLSFTVSDTGIGIAPEHREHIFSGFSQAEASTTRRFGGTGLGLAISQRLIGLMGGELVLDSTVGVGSTFSFAVRLQRQPAKAVLPVSTSADASSGAALDDLPREVVLIEPHVRSRVVLGQLLQRMGCTVRWADGLEELFSEPWNASSDASSAQGAARCLLVEGRVPGLAESLAELHASSPAWRVVAMGTMAVLQNLAERFPEGQGVEATLVKPVVEEALVRALAQAVQAGPHGASNVVDHALTAPARPPVLEGLRILVVEDNANNQQVAQELLQAQGAVVELASHGQEGVDRVRDADPPYDLVLMDLQMPVMDGLTATRHLRAWLDGRSLPICAMTANASEADRQNCLAAGCDDHVGKPFDLDRLLGVITRLTGRSLAEDLTVGITAGDKSDVDMPEAVPNSARSWALTMGLDLRWGLRRMGDHVGVYRRMLVRVLSDLDSHRHALADAWQAADPGRLAQLCHGLRGQVAQLGMAHLAARLSELEADAEDRAAALASGTSNSPSSSPSPWVPTPDAAWQAVQEALAPWLATASTLQVVWPVEAGHSSDTALKTAAVDPAVWRTKLANLKTLLEASDMQALAEFEALEPSLHRWDAQRCERLSRALDELAFERAGQEVAACLQALPA